MSERRPSNNAPFDFADSGRHFVIGPHGLRHPVLATTRRRVVIAHGSRQVRLCRRNLERHGVAVAAGVSYYISSYLPTEWA